MRTPRRRARDFYGAHPLHLLALLACFALAGYVAVRVAPEPTLPGMALWFAGAVIAHDLVLFPLYAAADRLLARLTHRGVTPTTAIPVINHVRVPALAAGLLLLVFLPGIIEQGAPTYLAATGQTQQPFLGRWLLLTAAFFATSAAVYAIRRVRASPPGMRAKVTGRSTAEHRRRSR